MLAASRSGSRKGAGGALTAATPAPTAAPEAEDIYVFKEQQREVANNKRPSKKEPKAGTPPPKKKAKPAEPVLGPDGEPLSRGQQRKQSTAERRSQKKGADVVEDLRQRWEKLRLKHMEKDERRALIDEAVGAIAGRVHEVVFKRDASRVVQSCLKYGSSEQRATICGELRGHYLALARSAYGKFLVAKVLKFCVSERSQVLSEFAGHCPSLLRHAESSELLDTAFTLYARAPERAAMLREFGGAEFALFKDTGAEGAGSLSAYVRAHPEKRSIVVSNLVENLKDLLNKGSGRLQMVHALLHEYVVELADVKEREDFNADLNEHIAELVHTRKGAEVAMTALLHGNAKDRKVMLKALKEVATKVAEDEHGHLVLLLALEVVDDTVLLRKSILSELLADPITTLSHKFARRPIAHVLVGRSRHYIHPANYQLLEATDSVRARTSKKDPAVRRAELLEGISPSLIAAVKEHAEKLLDNAEASEMVCEILLHARGRQEAFGAVADLVAAPYGADHPIDRIFLNRALKRLVVDEWKRPESVADDGARFAPVLLERLRGRLASYLPSYGGFVILALLESPVTADEVRAELAKSVDQIRAFDSHASRIIVRKLEEDGAVSKAKAPTTPAASKKGAAKKAASKAEPQEESEGVPPKRSARAGSTAAQAAAETPARKTAAATPKRAPAATATEAPPSAKRSKRA